MKRILALSLVVAGLAVAGGTRVDAADREHQQIMADIRMLQEQTQQLQLLLGRLTEALQVVTTKMDQQTDSGRKLFADQKLLVDGVAGDVRVVREKIDDTNVRLSSLHQEMQALHRAVAQIPLYAPPSLSPTEPGVAPADPSAPPAVGEIPAGLPPAPVANPVAGISPQRLLDEAKADYSVGQWALALAGFETVIKYFPGSEHAAEAQYYIGETHSLEGNKYREAEASYAAVIRDYPDSRLVPNAYYKRGLALKQLGQVDEAIANFEYVVTNYPDTDIGQLAKQVLERTPRPQR